MARTRSTPDAALAALVLTVALGLLVGISWAASPPDDRAARPTRVYPRRETSAALPRGSVLLVDVAQELANTIREDVYIAPGIAPTAAVTLDRALPKASVEAVASILEDSSFTLGRAPFEGRQVYWVSERLRAPTRKRGGIVPRRDDGGDDGDARAERRSPRGAGTEELRAASTEMDAIGDPGIRVFQRVDGSTRRFLVQFETDSAAEAEEIASMIRALRDSRRE